jgi:hypothetical protein
VWVERIVEWHNGIWVLNFVVAMLLGALVVALMLLVRWWLLFCLVIHDCYVAFGEWC